MFTEERRTCAVGTVVILHAAEGELTASSEDAVGAVRHELDAHMNDPAVIIDLSGVDAVDSSVIGQLSAFGQRRKGKPLKVCSLRPHVAEIFGVLRLSLLLNIAPNQEAAMNGPW